MSNTNPDGTATFLKGWPPVLAMTAVMIMMAAVVAPVVGGAGSGSRREEALAQANSIGMSLRDALDHGAERIAQRAGGFPRWLHGPGMLPKNSPVQGGKAFPLSGLLVRDEIGARDSWRGPYLDQIPIDPWGRAWVVDLGEKRVSGPILIVSAGADGIIQSSHAAGAMAGDDVGTVLSR